MRSLVFVESLKRWGFEVVASLVRIKDCALVRNLSFPMPWTKRVVLVPHGNERHDNISPFCMHIDHDVFDFAMREQIVDRNFRAFRKYPIPPHLRRVQLARNLVIRSMIRLDRFIACLRMSRQLLITNTVALLI